MRYDLGPHTLTRLRAAADLGEVVGDHVQLKRNGRRMIGLCPFHDERTPSFSVEPERGLYYCFGCHAGGDVIRFVMDFESLDFPSAVELLARRFRVELPPASASSRAQQAVVDQLRPLLEGAQRFFESRLMAEDGNEARLELERRGFAPSGWSEFGFGFAPASWREQISALTPGFSEKLLIEGGLAIQPDRGGRPYDRFRNRLTFPIRSSSGDIIAFGGRSLDDEQAKYINSPETALFQKRSVLFMLDRARRTIGRDDRAVIVEGYFDCFALHRSGIESAVATLGTALSEQHARVLGRLCSRVVLCYDGDEAGRKAAAAGARVLLERGLEVQVAPLPAGKDPDDLLREEGAEALRARIDSPVDLVPFLFSSSGDRRAAREQAAGIIEIVAGSTDPLARHNHFEAVARRLDLPLSAVTEQARRLKRRNPTPPRLATSGANMPYAERRLAQLLLLGPGSWRREALAVLAGSGETLISSEAARILVQTLSSLSSEVEDVLEHIPPDMTPLVAGLINSDEDPPDDSELERSLRSLQQRRRKITLSEIKQELGSARDDLGPEEVAELQRRILELGRQR